MKKLFQQSNLLTFLAYIGYFLGFIINIWLLPFVLTTNEIGLYKLIHGTTFSLLPFAKFGLGQSILKFFPKYNINLSLQSRFFGFTLILALLYYILFSCCMFYLQDVFKFFFLKKATLIIQYFELIITLIFPLIICSLLESWCYTLLYVTLPSFIRFFLIYCINLIFIYLYVIGVINLHQLFLSSVIIFSIQAIILSIYLFIYKKVKISFNIYSFIQYEKIKNIFIYSLYNLLYKASATLAKKTDFIMIGAMIGLHYLGIYATLVYISMLIELPRLAMRKMTSSLLAQYFEKKEYKKIKILYISMATHQFMLGLILFLFIYINLDYIFYIIPNKNIYLPSKTVILWLALGKLIDVLFGMSSEIIHMSPYYKFNVLGMIIFALFTIMTNYFMIPQYYIHGAAMATVLSLLLYNSTNFFFIYAKYKIHPFSYATLKLFFVGCLLVFIHHFIIPNFTYYWLNLLLNNTFLLIIYAYLIFILKISPQFNNFLWHFFKKNFFFR